MSWFGKDYSDNDEPTLEERVRALEKEKRQRERLDNFSMTTFMGGARPLDEDED
jgi:hypothetical protein